jgi:hypothetical protein
MSDGDGHGDDLAARARKAIEAAFDDNVKNAATQELFRLSGKMSTIDELMPSFDVALGQIRELRERQLAEVPKVFGGST